MKLGGFNESLQNCKICNYAIDSSELSGIMGSHQHWSLLSLLLPTQQADMST